MKATDTITLKVTPEELNVLHAVLQNMVKHAEAAEQVYATYQDDRSLVKRLAVLVLERVIEQQSGSTNSQTDGVWDR